MSIITFFVMLLAGGAAEFLADAPSTIPYLWVAKFIGGTAVFAVGLLLHPPGSNPSPAKQPQSSSPQLGTTDHVGPTPKSPEEPPSVRSL